MNLTSQVLEILKKMFVSNCCRKPKVKILNGGACFGTTIQMCFDCRKGNEAKLWWMLDFNCWNASSVSNFDESKTFIEICVSVNICYFKSFVAPFCHRCAFHSRLKSRFFLSNLCARWQLNRNLNRFMRRTVYFHIWVVFKILFHIVGTSSFSFFAVFFFAMDCLHQNHEFIFHFFRLAVEHSPCECFVHIIAISFHLARLFSSDSTHSLRVSLYNLLFSYSN